MADDALFHDLIVAAQTMLTVSRNAATVLSEEFETMITGPADALDAVLKRCPQPTEAWDGSIREEDLEVELFHSEGQFADEPPRGVKITHTLTGISGQSYSKPSQIDNRAVVMAYITRKVAEEYAARGDGN